jgi:hypothetical protein
MLRIKLFFSNFEDLNAALCGTISSDSVICMVKQRPLQDDFLGFGDSDDSVVSTVTVTEKEAPVT